LDKKFLVKILGIIIVILSLITAIIFIASTATILLSLASITANASNSVSIQPSLNGIQLNFNLPVKNQGIFDLKVSFKSAILDKNKNLIVEKELEKSIKASETQTISFNFLIPQEQIMNAEFISLSFDFKTFFNLINLKIESIIPKGALNE